MSRRKNNTITTIGPVVTPVSAALDELARRAGNKVAGSVYQAPAKDEYHQAVWQMSSADLRTLAGVTAPVKVARVTVAKVVKPKPDPEQVALRKQAWAWRAAEFAAGRKVTYDEALAKFGATRSRKVA
jgi:hypothetical protein